MKHCKDTDDAITSLICSSDCKVKRQVHIDEDVNSLNHSTTSSNKTMMSLWITILMLTRIVSSMEKEWDDFLLYDEDYDEDYQEDYQETEDGDGDLVADLDYFLNYEEIARLSRSLNSSNGSFQLDEDFEFTQDDAIFLDEAFDYDGGVDSDNITFHDEFTSDEFKVLVQTDEPIRVNPNWPVLVTGGVIFVICVSAIIILIIILIIKNVQAKKEGESTLGDAEDTPGEIENEEV